MSNPILPSLSPHEFRSLAEWLIGPDTGTSSMFMAATVIAALGGRVIADPMSGHAPRDASDLGRCIRLVERIPGVRSFFPVLREASPVWRAYVDAWDELATLWRDGDYEITTFRMDRLRADAGKVVPVMVQKDQVVMRANGRRYVAREDRPLEDGERILAGRPHEEGTEAEGFDYMCGHRYCRCCS